MGSLDGAFSKILQGSEQSENAPVEHGIERRDLIDTHGRHL